MNDVLLSPIRLSELEVLVEKSVRRALQNTPLISPPAPANPAPFLSSDQVKEMTGWPNGTFYQKVSEMPEGVVIRGKSKRLLFDRELLMAWLKTPVQP